MADTYHSSDSGAGPAAKPATPEIDPERWIDEHGDSLYHFALSRLRDPILAEDFVQEALLAALRAKERFEGRSSERSWLIGILKNKILDHFRKAGRETSFTDMGFYSAEEEQMFEPGDQGGHWNPQHAPCEWTQAGSSLDREEFWKAFQHCTSKLPDKIARVFLLREVDGMPSPQICETLKISDSNLWVMLHRARLALRECLEKNWFQKNGTKGD
jgi:RNA polymerase sigma-70 factor (ECF subfamily)